MSGTKLGDGRLYLYDKLILLRNLWSSRPRRLNINDFTHRIVFS